MKRKIALLIIATAIASLMTTIHYSVAQEQKIVQQGELLKKQRETKEQRKREREAAIKRLEVKLKPLMNYSIEELQLALTIKVIRKYEGARLYSVEDQPEYLGTITDEFKTDSVFNDFGAYGSKFSSTSIWNDFGRYGGEFSLNSAFNPFSSRPPIIIKDNKVIGHLTVNKFLDGAVDPDWLKSYFKY